MELLRVSHPGIDLDLRYATTDNITGVPIYRNAIAYLHPTAHGALMRAAGLAQAQGLRLRVFDAYRPASAQRALWSRLPDPTFVADPALGSNHTRGIAVDLTLSDAGGRPLEMGTGFDDMTPRSFHGDSAVPVAAQANRLLLAGLMAVAGFAHNPHEWWHYDLPNPAAYPLLEGCGADREIGVCDAAPPAGDPNK